MTTPDRAECTLLTEQERRSWDAVLRQRAWVPAAHDARGGVQVGEVGELSEIFQWRGDSVAPGLVGFSNDDKRHVEEEMSDVRPKLLNLSAAHRMLMSACCILPEQCTAASAAGK